MFEKRKAVVIDDSPSSGSTVSIGSQVGPELKKHRVTHAGPSHSLNVDLKSWTSILDFFTRIDHIETVDAIVVCASSNVSGLHDWDTLDIGNPDVLKTYMEGGPLGQMRLAHVALRKLASTASVTLTHIEETGGAPDVLNAIARGALAAFVKAAPRSRARVNLVSLQRGGTGALLPHRFTEAYVGSSKEKRAARQSNCEARSIPLDAGALRATHSRV